MENKQKHRKKTELLFSILIIVCLIVMGISLFKLITISLEYRKGVKEYDNLQSYTIAQLPEDSESDADVNSDGNEEKSQDEITPKEVKKEKAPVSVDFEHLKEINPDIVGWLYMPVLDMSYPIVQGTDNDQYLHRTFEGTDNFAGTLFADANGPEPFADCHTIVYGHNMKNQSMFGTLKKLLPNDTYKKNPYFWILTPERDYKYRMFNIGYTVATSDLYMLFDEPDEAFLNYVHELQESSSIREEDIPLADEKSRVVTLSTCVAAEGIERLIVQGITEVE